MKKYNYIFLCFILFAPIVTNNVLAMEDEIEQRNYSERLHDIFVVNEKELLTTTKGQLLIKIERYLNSLAGNLASYDLNGECTLTLRNAFRTLIIQLESWSKKEGKPIYKPNGLTGYAAIKNGTEDFAGYGPPEYVYGELGPVADIALQEVKALFKEIQTRDLVAGDLGKFVS